MKSMNCARYIIKQSLNLEIPVTNLQLQKILFVLASQYQANTGTYPFDEKFETWGYGPTIPLIYNRYSSYETFPIDSYILEEFDYDTFNFVNIDLDENSIDDCFKKLVNKYLKSLLSINIFNIVSYLRSQKFWYESNNWNVSYPFNEVKFNDGDTLDYLIKCNFKK